MTTTTTRFSPCELHGLTDAELCGRLRPADLIEPEKMYSPTTLSYFIDLPLREIETAYTYAIGDVRGRGEHSKAFGHAILDWLDTRSDVQARPDEIAIRIFRRENPELFKSPADYGNLGARMAREAVSVQRETEAADRQRLAEEDRSRRDRLAEIVSRYDSPQDGDVAAVIELSQQLGLGPSDVARLAKFVREAAALQQQRDTAALAVERAEDSASEVRSAFDAEHGEQRTKLLRAIEKCREALAAAEARLAAELGQPMSLVTAADRAVTDARRAHADVELDAAPKLASLAGKAPFLFAADGRLKYSPVSP